MTAPRRPEELQRQADAADALFREIVRKITEALSEYSLRPAPASQQHRRAIPPSDSKGALRLSGDRPVASARPSP
jgi:hypothetical protein